MRHEGFSRCTRRMAARASWSAAAVTVQVFSTTTSAAFASAAPSACVARQPKLVTKYEPIDSYYNDPTAWFFWLPPQPELPLFASHFFASSRSPGAAHETTHFARG